jgi:NADPH2:quinone reductase
MRNMQQLLEWFASGKINPVISDRVPLSGAATAMMRMANRQIVGKVVILPEA